MKNLFNTKYLCTCSYHHINFRYLAFIFLFWIFMFRTHFIPYKGCIK